MLTGNRAPLQIQCSRPPVYPRAYGEQAVMFTHHAAHNGLSPCLRGTAHSNAIAAADCRFIPVLTGNRFSMITFNHSLTVYPRAYGEQAARRSTLIAAPGLSPCLRGTVSDATPSGSLPRFIPVLTGNSFLLKMSVAHATVYPRAYGEQSGYRFGRYTDYGLSPCLRGTGLI